MLLDGSPGSSRILRLDPTALPLRFETSDAAADGGPARSSCIASGWCCGVRFPACAWR